MGTFLEDLRFGIRMQSKSPSFAIVAILTLSVGIGLNTAIFSVVNGVLFKPLPVRAPGELMAVFNLAPTGQLVTHEPMAYPDYKDLRDQSRSFSGLVGHDLIFLAVERGDESQMVTAEMVTENYFQTLGVQPMLGRGFLPEEGRVPGDDPVVVLSAATWRQRFGGDPGIVGRSIHVNGVAMTIVGVAPPNFPGMVRGIGTEMWVPMMMRTELHAGDGLTNRRSRWMFCLGRLAPGVTPQEAQAELSTIAARLQKQYPDTNKDRKVGLLPASEVKIMPGVDRVLYAVSAVMMIIVGLVLLIACANVANMMLARAAGRRKEMAVRQALGAGRGRLCRQLLTESLLLAIPGGLLGLLAGTWTNRVLNQFQLPGPVKFALGLSLDLRVLAFTFVVSVATVVFFGLAPVLRTWREDLAGTLKDESAGASSTREKRTLHQALVVGQVALSLVLLICAGLSLRSMQNAGRIYPGFDARGVADASLDVGLRGYTQAAGEAFYRQLRERAGTLPGVEAVAFANAVPLSFEVRTTSAAAEGRDAAPEKEWPEVDTASVGPGYFETMRIPLLRGRGFSDSDTAQAPKIAVVNQALAGRFWPGEDPIGKRIRVERQEGYYQVVGVAADGKYRTLGEEQRSYLYLSLLQNYESGQILLVRTAGDPSTLLPLLRQKARELDEHVPIVRLQTLEEATGVSLLLPRAGAGLFGLFGLLGVVLAAAGIYGVTAFAAAQRTQEMGIRRALGAQQSDILKLLVGQGVTVTLVGIGIGLAVAIGFTRVLSAILYGVTPTDVGTLGSVSLLFLGISALACYLPARRALRVDPVLVLRKE
ncbi:MAG TPA: ABC transporter permease [Candidatus Binatia bacterium]|nr:ABC transporter permease [Candidatus Binatia bacterium]